MTLEHASLRKLRAAPELAHVAVLLVAAQALERALRIAHGPLEHQLPPLDAPTVVWAAEVLVRLRALRHALLRYRTAVLRTLRTPRLRRQQDTVF